MKLYHYGMVFGLGLCLSACSLGPVKVPTTNTYMLTNSTTQMAPLSRPEATSLMIMPVTATRGFDSTAMLYQTVPYQLTSFVQNAWVAPPANMISPLLLKSIQQSNMFQAVVSGPSMNSTGYALNVKLLALYQDFTVKPSQIVLSLDVNLGDNQNNQVLADQVITVRVNTAAEAPYAGVVAANQALSQSLEDVIQFINASLPKASAQSAS